jgi:GR25 family glycosyltransferase involved in LPS biosynthesis
MLKVGITYNPSVNLFTSGSAQTSILLVELFKKMESNYDITLVNKTSSDNDWWSDFPRMENVTLTQLHHNNTFDILIDVDGYVNPSYRKKLAKKTIVFMRTFLQFSEMDLATFAESREYALRSFENVSEIWCWDILNPLETIPAVQTLFPCPIRTVPFIWSPSIAEHFSKDLTIKHNTENHEWAVHIAEKNNVNSSSSVLALVAVRELHIKNFINAKYKCHNMDKIIEHRFLKENILNNIKANTLPLEFVKKQPFYEWLNSENFILFSHTRFLPLRTGLLNAIWMGIPCIHNSPILKNIHPQLEQLFYFGNEITSICSTFKKFDSNSGDYYSAHSEIQDAILKNWSIANNLSKWQTLCSDVFNNINISNIHLPAAAAPFSNSQRPKISPVKKVSPISNKIIVGFLEMWIGFDYNNNLIVDGLRQEYKNQKKQLTIQGIKYEPGSEANIVIFGPFSKDWKDIPSHIPKVFFTGENWEVPKDESISLYLTPYRNEDEKHIRFPIWIMSIDWYSDSTDLSHVNKDDNPNRFPVKMAMTSHTKSFKDRKDFCAFIVSNPISKFRNETFLALDSYKRVNSGGGLYNNIGGQLELKYPGGGGGDIPKYNFLLNHKFSLSFENSQAPGYITEKVLHAKMAGCVPLYWGDMNTDTDFVPGSFINLSQMTSHEQIVKVIQKLEQCPEMCAKIAATPILNEEKKKAVLATISKISKKILEIVGITLISNNENLLESSPAVVLESSPVVISESSPPVVSESSPAVVLETSPVVISESSPPVVSESSPPVVSESSPPVVSETSPVVISETSPPVVSESKLENINKTFIVNLDTRLDRWQSLMKVEPYLENNSTRIAAVNGKTLKLDKSIYNIFKNNRFSWKKSVMGCFLSHIDIWTRIINEGEGVADNTQYLVLEDDVRFDKDWIDTWNKCVEHIPKDAELMYIGGVLPPNKAALPSCLEEVNQYWSQIKPNMLFSPGILLPIFHFCTYSYVITKSGARKLLDFLNTPSDYQITECDHFLGNHMIGLKKYILSSLICHCFQDEDETYINSQFNDVNNTKTFDSDICNNTECFTDADIESFRLKLNSKSTEIDLYYFNKNEPYDLYEMAWTKEIFGKDINLTAISSFLELVPNNSWFIVQRPHLQAFNKYFLFLQENNINFKVLHLSDEFHCDDLKFYSYTNCKGVIRNYIRPDVPCISHTGSALSHILTVPLGFHYKGTSSKTFDERSLTWSFHGTDWFNRKEILEKLQVFVPNNCHFTNYWNDPKMTNESKYLNTLSNSKFCPIPRGNNIETFRLYEVLEMGTIPIYVRVENDIEFWDIISTKLQLIHLDTWEKAIKFVKLLLDKKDYAEKYRLKLIENWKIWKDEIKLKCQKLQDSN